MALEFAVGQVAHVQPGHLLESGAAELVAHLLLAGIGGHQVESLNRLVGRTQGQIQHPHDAGVDRGAVFDLECRDHPRPLRLEPQHVDQPHRIGPGHTGNRSGKAVDTTIAQPASGVFTATVVGGDPHRKPQR